jgi:hypothetical protein
LRLPPGGPRFPALSSRRVARVTRNTGKDRGRAAAAWHRSILVEESEKQMQISNIDRLLIFREEASGAVLTLEELQAKYGIDPDGTNFYYGINSVNLGAYNASVAAGDPTAINDTDRTFFAALLASVQASSDDEKTLVLGLEPDEAPAAGAPADPYGFVSANGNLLTQLAQDLNGIQVQARQANKRLNIIIRYASEMNDGGQIQGNNPAQYIATFQQVREIFRPLAPSVLFSFSPALRADLPEADITQYWPGDDVVDVIGGTWYIGAPEQRDASVANMRAYFLHRVGANRPFAISEVGGHGAAGLGNDAVLQDMFHEMEALQLQSVSFTYVTIFLQGVWGTDATLAFLQSGS